MLLIDASSIIYAWDNYPIRQFPGLWVWMAEQFADKQLVLSRVAYGEVADKAPECGAWLRDANTELIEITNAIVQEALKIKRLLGITADNYHAKGVGENDILIIATAVVNNVGLVSDEKRQQNPPDIPAKRKIPAVCAMDDVGVLCTNFIEFIKRSEAVFG
jgi:predicted nucleic acid-binding protein